MKGHDLFHRTLSDLELSPLFGNPGSTEIPMLRGVGKYILTLHDSISAGMADGYAQYTGRPAVVNLHTLPGVANSMAFIHTAKANKSPVIITSGQQDTRHMYSEPLLWHDLSELVKGAVKYSYEVKDPADIEKSLKRAYSMSLQPPSGPVFVSFPMDIMDGEAEYSHLTHTIPNTDVLDQFQVNKVSELLNISTNPAIVAGSEIDQYDAHRELMELAETLGLPVYAEPLSSRAAVDSNSTSFAGDLPPATTAINLSLLKHDLILNIGGGFTIYPYLPSPLLPGKKVVTISMSPTFLHGEYVNSNPKLFLKELLKSTQRRWNYVKPSEEGMNSLIARERRTMGPNYVLQKVRKIFQGYTIVDEAISSSLLVRKNLGYSPKSYFTAKSGQLGWGLPAAAGISLAHSKVIEVVGDGSLMYSIQALWTISNYGLPVKILVLDNEGYTILKSFSQSYYPGVEKEQFLSFKTNISDIASSFGVEAKEAQNDLKELEWLREGEKPKLLVVHMSKSIPKLFP